MDIISREEAKEQGLKRYYTGVLCPKGHDAMKLVSNYTCVKCTKEKALLWEKNNQEKTKEYKNKWATKNKEKEADKRKQYYQTNQEKVIEKVRKWRQDNKEKVSEWERKWRHANPEKVGATRAKRRASKLQRTTAWANFEDIRMWYEVAEVLSRSGVKFHVDHVVPLQGKIVSGLHVEDNLTVIPAYLNFSKNNQWTWEKQSHE